MNKILRLCLMAGFFLLTSCSFSFSTAPTQTQPDDTPTPILFPTSTALPATAIAATTIPPTAMHPTSIPLLTPTNVSIPPASTNICTDPRVATLIDSLKSATLNADGALLSSLVSPNGVDVRWVHSGNVIKYLPEQAKFLFETTFEADWGAAPGSGEAKMGSFHDVIVPDLEKIFKSPYTLHCNELKYGGATYEVDWPYTKDFYSIYDAGTQQNGNMDWRTWVAGIEYSNGKPYMYALMQFFWEP